MNNIKNLIEQIKIKQTSAITLLNEVDQKIREIESSITDLLTQALEKEFPGVEFNINPCFLPGSHSLNWTPQVFIQSVMVDDDNCALKFADGWYIFAGYALYRHNASKVEMSFKDEDLARVLNNLSVELGVEILIAENEFDDTDAADNMRTIDDLRAVYPDAEVLLDGKMWYMGWDIPDHYAILKMDDGMHLFYSTNGHGFGYDIEAKPGEMGGFKSLLNLAKDSTISVENSERLVEILSDYLGWVE